MLLDTFGNLQTLGKVLACNDIVGDVLNGIAEQFLTYRNVLDTECRTRIGHLSFHVIEQSSTVSHSLSCQFRCNNE